MEERPLTIHFSDDKTLFTMSEQDKATATKEIGTLQLSFQQLLENFNDGTLENGYRETLCTVIESSLLKVLHLFAYEGDLHKQKEARHKDMRELNQQNRELRRQLGEKVSNEDARERMKNMAKVVEKWWNQHGFGHTSELFFTNNGYIKVKFSSMITSNYHNDGMQSTHTRAATLAERGFQLKGNDFTKSEDREIMDNEHNRKLLEQLIVGRFPSADITSITNWAGRKSECFIMRDIDLYIFNLDDLTDGE